MFPRVNVSLVLLSITIAVDCKGGYSRWSVEEAFPDSAKGHYPFMISIRSPKHACSGAVLNDRWIITTGHCAHTVTNVLANFSSLHSLYVGAGKLDLKDVFEQTVQVERAFVHENYDGDREEYDIGLLKLASPLNFTKQVQPIKLPPPDSEPTGEAWLCRWNSWSFEPQHAKMEYVNSTTCYESFNDKKSIPLYVYNICTRSFYRRKFGLWDPLYRDPDISGFLISRNGKRAMLTGILSWNTFPLVFIKPIFVYTQVSKFNDWIAEKIYNN